MHHLGVHDSLPENALRPRCERDRVLREVAARRGDKHEILEAEVEHRARDSPHVAVQEGVHEDNFDWTRSP